MLKLGRGETAKVVKQGIMERSLVLRGESSAEESTLSIVPQLKEFWDEREVVVDALRNGCRALAGLTRLDQVHSPVHQRPDKRRGTDVTQSD